MQPMTGIERMTNLLKHQPVDRIGLYEHFWSDTHREWESAGAVKAEDSFDDLFGYDMSESWALNLTADIDFKPQVLEETEDTVLMLDGNGAMLRRHKKHDATPEHVGYKIQTREDWEEQIKPLLVPDPRRINFEGYRNMKAHCREKNRFFVLSGINVFEAIHPLIGHVNFLMSMALDPEWVEDMVKTYTDLILGLQEILFEKEGMPDGIWYYEDMGYKGSPFMSPDMYNELIKPGHQRTFAHAHARKLPVIVHSCGFVEPLLPGMIDAGMDMLQVIEVKAGMDLLRIHKNYGEKIGLMGGIDVRALYSNNFETIDRELESKIPFVKQGFAYALHSDHSIPCTVNIESYRHFIEKGLELGAY